MLSTPARPVWTLGSKNDGEHFASWNNLALSKFLTEPTKIGHIFKTTSQVSLCHSAEHKFSVLLRRHSNRVTKFKTFFSVFLPLFHLRELLFPIFWIFPLKLLIEFYYFRNFCWTLFTYCNSFLHYFPLNWELDLNCGYTLSVIYYFLSVFVVISSFKDFENLK